MENPQEKRWKKLMAKAEKLWWKNNDVRATKVAQEALKVVEQVLGANSRSVARVLHLLGEIYSAQGDYAKAKVAYHQALKINEMREGTNNLTLAGFLDNTLAGFYVRHAKYVEAEAAYKRALAIYKKVEGPYSFSVVVVLDHLAYLVYRAQGRFKEAEALLKRAVAIEGKVPGPGCLPVALNHLTALYKFQGRFLDVENLCKHAVAIRKRRFGLNHPATAMTLGTLADLYSEMGRYTEAEPLYRRTLVILRRKDPDNMFIVFLYKHFAACLRTLGRKKEASLWEARALKDDVKWLKKLGEQRRTKSFEAQSRKLLKIYPKRGKVQWDG